MVSFHHEFEARSGTDAKQIATRSSAKNTDASTGKEIVELIDSVASNLNPGGKFELQYA